MRLVCSVKIDVPRSAVIDVQREWLLIRLRDEWSVEGTTYASGSLLAADVEAFLAGGRDLAVLFEPSPDVALNYHTWTRHHLMLGLLRDVRSELVLLDPADGWRRSTLDGVPPDSHTTVSDTDPDRSDELLLASTGFTEPTTLRYGQVGGALEVLKREPSFFDIDGLSVRQFFATSPDATLVPYFVVGVPDRTGPTLLSAYGGFEISLTPYYDGTLGRAWLSRGWHVRGGQHPRRAASTARTGTRAAMREKRPLAFADCAAVAADLVDRGIATPERLGFEGGSNGGLLAGVMLTRYPEHFGAIVGMVPLLDMRRYHKLLAGASWIAEYGDPDNPDDWGFLRRYSPYQNLHSGLKLPPALWVTSHPGRPGAPGARPEDGRPDAGAGLRRHLLREHRGRPWRRGRQRPARLPPGPGLRVPVAHPGPVGVPALVFGADSHTVVACRTSSPSMTSTRCTSRPRPRAAH